ARRRHHVAEERQRAAGVGEVPADDHRHEPADEQEDKAEPEELARDDLVIARKEARYVHGQPQCASVSSSSYFCLASSDCARDQASNSSALSTVMRPRIL